MRRVLGPLVVLLGGVLVLPALLSLARAPQAAAARARAAQPALNDRRQCKPQPPVAVQLEPSAADGEGVVELSFAITPHADAGALAWSLVLPPGAELLEGEASGSLPASSPGTGALTARVQLPPGAPAARVLLQVEAALSTAAGTRGERVQLHRALTWGRPAVGAVERKAEDGSGRLAVAPARHREGR